MDNVLGRYVAPPGSVTIDLMLIDHLQ
jgi:hypothetical protein